MSKNHEIDIDDVYPIIADYNDRLIYIDGYGDCYTIDELEFDNFIDHLRHKNHLDNCIGYYHERR